MSRRPSSLFAACLVLAACSAEDDGAVPPTAGEYVFERAEMNGGTCNPDNSVPGTVQYHDAVIELVDGGFTMVASDVADDVVIDCALSGVDFTCTIPEQTLGMSGATRLVATLTAAGTWTDADAFEFTVTGKIGCAGEAAVCQQFASDLDLELLCDMTSLHVATLRG